MITKEAIAQYFNFNIKEKQKNKLTVCNPAQQTESRTQMTTYSLPQGTKTKDHPLFILLLASSPFFLF